MGGAKSSMAELDGRFQIAVDLAIEVGVLERCDIHDHIFSVGIEPVGAYMEAAKRFKAGEYSDTSLGSQKDLTDAIKQAVEEN